MRSVPFVEAQRVLQDKVLEVRNPGLLASALERPVFTMMSKYMYDSLEKAAAAQTESIVGNHPMVDGNKRTAVYMLYVFLHLNGHTAEFTREGLFNWVYGVADGSIDMWQSEKILAEVIVPL